MMIGLDLFFRGVIYLYLVFVGVYYFCVWMLDYVVWLMCDFLCGFVGWR